MSETLSFYPNRNQITSSSNNTGIDEFYEFLNTTNGTPFNVVATGGAAINFNQNPYLSGCNLEINSAAANTRIALTTSSTFGAAVEPIMIGPYNGSSLQMRCKLLSAPIAADSVRIKFGFITNFNAIPMNNGATAQSDLGWFFFYHSEYSPNWQCIGNYVNPTTNVLIDSGVPVTDADTYLAIVWSKTNCSFLINNTPVAAPNIPSGAAFNPGQSIGVCMEQQANGGNTLVIDAIKFKTEFDTPRSFF